MKNKKENKGLVAFKFLKLCMSLIIIIHNHYHLIYLCCLTREYKCLLIYVCKGVLMAQIYNIFSTVNFSKKN